jgi:hypothetical protein
MTVTSTHSFKFNLKFAARHSTVTRSGWCPPLDRDSKWVVPGMHWHAPGRHGVAEWNDSPEDSEDRNETIALAHARLVKA